MNAPRGRPKIELDDDEIRQVEVLAGYGMTKEEIADVLDIGRATLERLAGRDERIFEALQKGRAKAKARVLAAAFELATNGRNASMTMFYLKCRYGWIEEAAQRAFPKRSDGGELESPKPQVIYLTKSAEVPTDGVVMTREELIAAARGEDDDSDPNA